MVVTGGPGAGKTALLELARKAFCEHVAVLPEAATILFSGGFPRAVTTRSQKFTQRAIFHVQSELERVVRENPKVHLILCDRGTLDGLAYWPGDARSFFREGGTTRARELAKYWAVLHLHTPRGSGYNYVNPFRIETYPQAVVLDKKILRAWKGHPRRFLVDGSEDFMKKAQSALKLLRQFLPSSCQVHV